MSFSSLAAKRWPLFRGPVELLLLAVTIGALFGTALNVGEFWWTDEPRHAMDGVWMFDILRDHPFRHLYDYTVRYYAQYPALSLNWYPPLFALVESAVYSVAGISEFSSRVTVLLFISVGSWVWLTWMRGRFGHSLAVTSILLILTNSAFVLWGRSVMLEVPALTMMIIGAFMFLRFLSLPTYRRSVTAGFAIAAALLLKQTAALVLPAFFALPFLTRESKVLLRRESLPGYVFVLAALGLLAAHALTFGTVGIQSTLGSLHEAGGGEAARLTFERWMLYPKVLAEAWPIYVLAGCALGIALTFSRRPAREDILFGVWLVSCYFVATLVLASPENAGRYTIYFAPPIAYFTCRPLASFVGRPLKSAYLAGAWVVLAVQANAALHQPVLYTSGYAEASQIALAQVTSGRILFAGKNDGNFILHVRKDDESHERFVLRADKILLSMSVHKYFGIKSYVSDRNDIIRILDKFGVSAVVIEEPDVVGLSEFQLLREALNGSEFELLARVPIATNVPEYSNLAVLVYRYRNAQHPEGDLVIPMPQMSREIRVPG